MLNITYRLALLSMYGVLLTAGSNESDASNAYNPQTGYWACPAEVMAAPGKQHPGYPTCLTEIMEMRARADNLIPATDAPVFDKPDQPASPLEEERRYYDYSRLILGD